MISGAEQAAHALTLGATQVIEKPAGRDELSELFGSIAETVPAAGKRKRRKPRRGRARRRAASARARRDAAAHRRRRHPQHLLAGQRARGARREVLHAERGAEGIAHPRAESRHRRRADRHHDARNGRLRDDAADPREPRARAHPADRGHRQGDEGRPAEVPRCRRVGLHLQAGRHRPAAGAAAGLDRPLEGRRRDRPRRRCRPPREQRDGHERAAARGQIRRGAAAGEPARADPAGRRRRAQPAGAVRSARAAGRSGHRHLGPARRCASCSRTTSRSSCSTCSCPTWTATRPPR